MNLVSTVINETGDANGGVSKISETYLPDADACWEDYFTKEIIKGGNFIRDLETPLDTVHFWTKVSC